MVQKNKCYRYVLVVIDNFSKSGKTIPMKSEISQTIKYTFERILKTWKTKTNLHESDEEKEILNIILLFSQKKY